MMYAGVALSAFAGTAIAASLPPQLPFTHISRSVSSRSSCEQPLALVFYSRVSSQHAGVGLALRIPLGLTCRPQCTTVPWWERSCCTARRAPKWVSAIAVPLCHCGACHCCTTGRVARGAVGDGSAWRA
eukprot:5948665-Pyramimonas_sp.AAC.2